MILSPIEKVRLARAHRVSTWLDEGITSLALSDDSRPTLEELATLGWETAARILWIRDNSGSSLMPSQIPHFTKDSIKCGHCSSSSSLMPGVHDCYHCNRAVSGELTCTDPGLLVSGCTDRLVQLMAIRCGSCSRPNAFYSVNIRCSSCQMTSSRSSNVKITPKRWSQMIKEMFGEEIKSYELYCHGSALTWGNYDDLF